VCRGLTLIHPAPRRPAAYGVSSDLTTTPSCPRATASAKNSDASAAEDVTSRGMSSAAGTAEASEACRSASGRSIRSAPSRCSTSNRNTDNGGPSKLAARDEVSWNGIGRPSGRSAISSPSNTAARTGSWLRTATTSGSRPVISSSVRVNNRTPPEARCAWIRIPSSFHSTAASTPAPIFANASAIELALAASIGRTGRPTSSPNSASAAPPPASAAAATAPSEPRSIIARRTSATGTDAARATASVITPSSAPCRSSPESNPTRKRCSSAVARPNSSPTSALRAAAEPFPLTAPIAENPASTSLSESAGTTAAGNPSRSAAQPTPICRCGSSPDRYATAIGTSSGPASRSAPASDSTLASRALVAPTSRDTSAISASSMHPT
jgi:hypothetical protein